MVPRGSDGRGMRGTARAGANSRSVVVARGLVALACVAFVLLIAACGGSGQSAADATATAEAALPTPTPIPLQLGELTWSSEVDPATGAPVDALTALPNDAPQVVAVLHVPSLPAGTTVQAHWTIDGDALPNLAPEPIVTEAPLEDAWLSWRLTWNDDQPWPIGALGIRVEIDGQEVANDDIRIVRASS